MHTVLLLVVAVVVKPAPGEAYLRPDKRRCAEVPMQKGGGARDHRDRRSGAAPIRTYVNALFSSENLPRQSALIYNLVKYCMSITELTHRSHLRFAANWTTIVYWVDAE